MGKFDGILIASDWDGTLYYEGQLFEENIKAIRYFQENGGKFTVCSGRYYNFLKNFSDDIEINTYTVCYNGAYIVDMKTDEVMYEGFCDDYIYTIIDNLISLGLNYKWISFYTSSDEQPLQYEIEDYVNIKQRMQKKKCYKVLLRSDTPEHAEKGVEEANSMDLRDYIAVRSWNVSLEIMKKENAKGAAIRRIADKLGSSLVVAVGDYENDLEMIRAADIGYAVDNAVDTLKTEADRITVHANKSAIAKIIEDIEKEFCK